MIFSRVIFLYWRGLNYFFHNNHKQQSQQEIIRVIEKKKERNGEERITVMSKNYVDVVVQSEARDVKLYPNPFSFTVKIDHSINQEPLLNTQKWKAFEIVNATLKSKLFDITSGNDVLYFSEYTQGYPDIMYVAHITHQHGGLPTVTTYSGTPTFDNNYVQDAMKSAIPYQTTDRLFNNTAQQSPLMPPKNVYEIWWDQYRRKIGISEPTNGVHRFLYPPSIHCPPRGDLKIINASYNATTKVLTIQTNIAHNFVLGARIKQMYIQWTSNQITFNDNTTTSLNPPRATLELRDIGLYTDDVQYGTSTDPTSNTFTIAKNLDSVWPSLDPSANSSGSRARYTITGFVVPFHVKNNAWRYCGFETSIAPYRYYLNHWYYNQPVRLHGMCVDPFNASRVLCTTADPVLLADGASVMMTNMGNLTNKPSDTTQSHSVNDGLDQTKFLVLDHQDVDGQDYYFSQEISFGTYAPNDETSTLPEDLANRVTFITTSISSNRTAMNFTKTLNRIIARVNINGVPANNSRLLTNYSYDSTIPDDTLMFLLPLSVRPKSEYATLQNDYICNESANYQTNVLSSLSGLQSLVPLLSSINSIGIELNFESSLQPPVMSPQVLGSVLIMTFRLYY